MKKPPLEERLAAALAPRLAGKSRLLVILGGAFSLLAGIGCALALALFLMGMAQGRTSDQAATVWVTGAICVALGALSWAGWLVNRVGRLSRR
jgi:hypothetical protein